VRHRQHVLEHMIISSIEVSSGYKVEWTSYSLVFRRKDMLQGALDGGLDIPHNEKRFVGYDADAKEFDAEAMRKYIFGGHVAEYMEGMEEEEPEKFRSHFALYLGNEVEADADEIEEMYGKVCEEATHVTCRGAVGSSCVVLCPQFVFFVVLDLCFSLSSICVFVVINLCSSLSSIFVFLCPHFLFVFVLSFVLGVAWHQTAPMQ
jgi:hypothetical protein